MMRLSMRHSLLAKRSLNLNTKRSAVAFKPRAMATAVSAPADVKQVRSLSFKLCFLFSILISFLEHTNASQCVTTTSSFSPSCAWNGEANDLKDANFTDFVLQNYDALCKKLRDINNLGGISGLLSWDEVGGWPHA